MIMEAVAHSESRTCEWEAFLTACDGFTVHWRFRAN